MDAQKAVDISFIAANYWQIIAGVAIAVFLLIIWCVRLEAKVLYLERDHADLKSEHKEKSITVWTKLDLMQTSMNSILSLLGEMKGRLDIRDARE